VKIEVRGTDGTLYGHIDYPGTVDRNTRWITLPRVPKEPVVAYAYGAANNNPPAEIETVTLRVRLFHRCEWAMSYVVIDEPRGLVSALRIPGFQLYQK
jgi:hypothetical protein